MLLGVFDASPHMFAMASVTAVSSVIAILSMKQLKSIKCAGAAAAAIKPSPLPIPPSRYDTSCDTAIMCAPPHAAVSGGDRCGRQSR